MANLNDLPQMPQNPANYGAGPQGPTAGPPPMGSSDREPNRDARMWATFAHLAGFAGALPVVPLIGCLIGPLVIWLMKREQFPFVDEQGKEAVNFQITMLICALIASPFLFICIGGFLLAAVLIVDVVLVVLAAIKANDGIHFRYPYPFIIRFIK